MRNCGVCGNPFILGTDQHKRCRNEGKRLADRDRRIDALLRLHADEIDALLTSES